MNRKLDNSLIALTASGLALVAIALIASPAFYPAPGSRATPVPVVESAADADAGERRSRTVGRRGLAMPYFSFARGVRRIGG
ncbi:hypothetical protein GCM10007164_05930 [Luteimonas padinae]|uniref:Uncharacterized protein n=1 Tax=Luteimonas padinae TaxID=1714359 RepID=A0ABV6SZF2_9GAMM|nr:hypothetical protein [Luteimonas padinae]GHD66734.1 hypothetical protein GCM10007164_05930 [Luteimonas padinae]